MKTRSASGRAKQKQREQDENSPADAIAKTERRLSGLTLRCLTFCGRRQDQDRQTLGIALDSTADEQVLAIAVV